MDEDKALHVAELILQYFEGGAWEGAKEIWLEADLDADQRVAIWAYFDSRQRAWLKGEDRKYINEYISER